jgi:hypothetical protein
VQCRRIYKIDRFGSLVAMTAAPEGRPATPPLTFARLRGMIAPAFRIGDEDLGAVRSLRREST